MDTPVVQLSRRFGQGIEGGGRLQENALQPHGEWLNWFRCGTWLGINFDDMRGVARAVVLGETSHGALFQLFDPFDFPLKTIADVNGEAGVFGVKDISFGASLKGVSVGFDEVFESADSSVELAHFSRVIVFSLFDSSEQCLGDALQGVGVEIGAAVENVSS